MITRFAQVAYQFLMGFINVKSVGIAQAILTRTHVFMAVKIVNKYSLFHANLFLKCVIKL